MKNVETVLSSNGVHRNGCCSEDSAAGYRSRENHRTIWMNNSTRSIENVAVWLHCV